MGTSNQAVIDAASDYLARGWQPIPVPASRKFPIHKGWPSLKLTETQLPKYFRGNNNVGLLLGEASGWLVDVDLDCEEARELADQYLPPTPAVTGRPSNPRSHRWYIVTGCETKKYNDPHSKTMIVELRSTGTHSLVGPSTHPCGETYEMLSGEPATVPAPMLSVCVAALAKAVVKQRHGDVPPPTKSTTKTIHTRDRSLTTDLEDRALAYLNEMPSAISGQGGHNATYAAATVLVHGFAIAPERALELLLVHYNPRCEPPWSEKELQHKVNDAATKSHDRPLGWLRDAERDEPPFGVDADVDISQLVAAKPEEPVDRPREIATNPGLLPPEMLRVPGFISEVMDHCLETAPYPNPVLAFCGGLALQAFLGGRCVRDQADNRTNIYLLGLAYSSVGKDWPRKLNTKILHQVGLAGCVGDGFASGEGIQDLMLSRPRMLFQTDEIDGMLQSINRAPDARHESIMSTLLRMYSASNSVFPMRPKAGRTTCEAIDQPCLVLFGTAIPNHYYEALSERMLTNGCFARSILAESGPRSPGQEPRVLPLPERVLETAKWWSNFRQGTGNLENWHPEPAIVEYTPEAQKWLIDSRKECEAEYAAAEARGDPVGTTVWGRVNEHSRKLALLYAISENARSPVIGLAAVRWGTQFATRQARRMLYMAANHVADNPFHSDCLRLMEKLRHAPDQTLSHSVLLKRMKVNSKTFQEIIDTLAQQGDLERCPVETRGRRGVAYRVVNEG